LKVLLKFKRLATIIKIIPSKILFII